MGRLSPCPFALWRKDQAWDWAEAEVAEGSFIKLTGHLPEMSLSCRVFELKVAEERVWRLTSTASIHGLRMAGGVCPVFFQPGLAGMKQQFV